MSVFGMNANEYSMATQTLDDNKLQRGEQMRMQAMVWALSYPPRKEGDPAPALDIVVNNAAMIYDFLVAGEYPELPEAKVVPLKAVDN